MRLYLDTEFNGFGGELISMALTSPAGREWYCVRQLPERIDPWVAENVIPKLGFAARFTDSAFRKSFHDFILGFDNPEVICDWSADAAHFFNWLSGHDYGTSLDFACQMSVLKTPPGYPKQGPDSHNALYDARALMDWHLGLAKCA